MIREIKLSELSMIEDLLHDFLKGISPNEEAIPQIKERLLAALERKERTLFAAIANEQMPFGICILNPSNNEITAVHPLDSTWKKLFTQVFEHLKPCYEVIRIPGSAVPCSMYASMAELGFSSFDNAHMTIQRDAVESLVMEALPTNHAIDNYSDAMKSSVAEMLFESYRGAAFTLQYPDVIGSVDACQKTLELLDEATELYIMMDDGVPASSCSISTQAEYGVVGLVATRPESRRRGLGRAIVLYAIKDSLKQNPMVESVLLNCVHNGPAFHLYESMGFVTTTIAPQFAWVKKE